MKKTKRESEREKSSNLANSVISSHAAKTAIPSPANNLMPSHAAKNATPSSFEEAVETGAFNLQEAKDLINLSRGIGTPGQALMDHARRIVGKTDIKTVDDDDVLETFGTTDRFFIRGLVGQILNAGSIGGDRTPGIGGDGYDFVVSVLRGAKPKDQIAAMLASQMAATHMAAIKFIGRLAQFESTELHDCHERTLSKLLRAFIMQVEAFNRYQNGGEQKVTVQQVSVSEGSQAIVGNVTQNALAKPAGETPALTDARQPAMPPINDKLEREPVPLRRRRKDDEEYAA
jgi:hypothetical protein